MNDRRVWAVMAVIVVAIWLVGAAVTRYSLERMAYYTPIAVVVVGATVGLVLLWVKVITDSIRRRRSEQRS
jgi:uncharacterized membrane protein